jgi:exopolyphosphatase / guanosine-5'-triphosphate,3'-diphosphate pyrophosphatase
MRVAVIDVGSNSIKLLVAEAQPDASLLEIGSATLDVRISSGIGAVEPRLSAEGIELGAAAVAQLATEARTLGAECLVAVATSAVRDASNGAAFRDRLRADAGLDLRILTGLEEATLIGKGLTTDPDLGRLRDFNVFDLGGGSLECLFFRNRAVESAVSLPLGCVRMTEKFVADPSLSLGAASARTIGDHVAEALLSSGFPFPVRAKGTVVGTGGTLTTVRAMVAAKQNVALLRTDPRIGVPLLRELLAEIAPLDLAARRTLPGLPPTRADVFPAALLTLLALAETGRFEAFHHSFRNLRWGAAVEAARTSFGRAMPRS